MNVTRHFTAGIKELLLREKVLDDETAARAQDKAEERGESFAETAIGLGFVTETDVARTLVKALGLPYLDATRYFINKELFDLLPIEAALKHKILPLDVIGNTLVVAICDCMELSLLEKISRKSGLKIKAYVTTYGAFMNVLNSAKPEIESGGNKKRWQDSTKDSQTSS